MLNNYFKLVKGSIIKCVNKLNFFTEGKEYVVIRSPHIDIEGDYVISLIDDTGDPHVITETFFNEYFTVVSK